MTSRCGALFEERCDGNLQSGGELSRDIDGDARDPILQAIDLEVGDTEQSGEVAPAEVLRNAKLFDSPRNIRPVVVNVSPLVPHKAVVSEPDTARKTVSTPDTQVGVTVHRVRPLTDDLSLEDAEAWIAELGVSADKLLESAGVGTEWKVVKLRWKKNEAPKDRAKITSELLKLEAKRGERRTTTGSRLLGLEEWKEIGAKLALNPELFEREIERLRSVADKVKRKHDADREAAAAAAELEAELSTSHGIPKELGTAFESPTPKPKGNRK